MRIYENFLSKVEPKLNSFEDRWLRATCFPIISLFSGPVLVLAGTSQIISGTVTGIFFRLQYQTNTKNSLAFQRAQYSFKHVKHGFGNIGLSVFYVVITNTFVLLFPPALIACGMAAFDSPPREIYPLK